MHTPLSSLPVAIIGAGPVGLAAAAHLVGRDLTPLIFEAGATIAAHLESYRHVQFFSPWHFNIDPQAQRLLVAHGWSPPPADALPTAGQMLDDYLTPLAHLPSLAPHLYLNSRVLQISRAHVDKVTTPGRDEAPFVLRVQTPSGLTEHRAVAVLDASGTWGTPNPLGANGLPALGEEAAAADIVYGMPDILGAARGRYASKRVLVVGAGHSAIGNLLALAQLAEEAPGTQVVWAVRGTNLARHLGAGERDGLPARGALGLHLQALMASARLEVYTGFRVQALQRLHDQITVLGEAPSGEPLRISGIDTIISATGSRPDLRLARELRLQLDPWLESTAALAPLIDPNVHSCGTVPPHGHRALAHPEPGYYAVGAKSYGRAPNFLMATGYEQVRSVVAALAHDAAAADLVTLTLPATGVCSLEGAATTAACCGGPAPDDVTACCVLDAQAKAQGQDGCGCHEAVAAG